MRFFPAVFVLLLVLAPFAAEAEDTRWYRSNAAGMALEEVFSASAALRNAYALSRSGGDPEDLPVLARLFFEDIRGSAGIETGVLYEKGVETRRQWIVRNGNVPRLVVVLGGDEETEGFVEVYNERGLLTAVHEFSGGRETITSYVYRGGVPLTAETREKEGEAERLLYTDTFRYRRSGSIRTVVRVYGGPQPYPPSRFSFAGGFPGAGDSFISPGADYGSDMLRDLLPDSGCRVVYDNDSRGRVVSETYYNEHDEILGTLYRQWSGDRLGSVSWKTASEDEERLTEYEYDEDGNRAAERNYRAGELERTMIRSGEQEIEELYLKGKLILRAVWEGGRKISEERIP
jgi:YD repeat-containing protein